MGRFGLNIHKPVTTILSSGEDLEFITATRELESFKEIVKDQKYLVSYYPKISKPICEEHGYDYIKVLGESKYEYNKEQQEFQDVSLVISAAITSYARIFMSQIKLDVLNNGGNIYYTDTDSLVTDIPLKDGLIGPYLGQFKLEHKVKEGYFISAKTYGLVTDKGFIAKSKGKLENTLSLEDFKNLYKGIDVFGIKRIAITNYVIKYDKVKLNHDSYTKRDWILDSKARWVNTKIKDYEDLNINRN